MVFDYTFWIVFIGVGCIGITAGVLGTFCVLRKQSLLGDAISHAALPGIGVAFLLTLSKNPIYLTIGALLAGWLGTLFIRFIIHNTSIKTDAALGIILSVFFGAGIVCLTLIQSIPVASQSGLTTYLFGNAATLLKSDIWVMGLLSSVSLAGVGLFWKEFKILTFDPWYCESLGIKRSKFDILLLTFIVIAIVIGLQSVGVVLMSAMIISPTIAARQWTDSLGGLVCLSAFMGFVGCSSGVWLSSLFDNVSTGPVIVLVLGVIVLLSLFFAPKYGLVYQAIVRWHHRRNIQESVMLTNFLLFSESDTDPFHPHDIAALTAIGRGPAFRALRSLKQKGLVQEFENQQWALTPQGLQQATAIQKDTYDEY